MLNLLDYKKIMIIGNNGSGKSYFAKELSKITNMPLFHLDLEFWKPNWEHISENEWIEKQISITSGREWIIDGNHTETMEIRFSQADLIIFLDINRLICLKSVIKRHKKSHEDLPDFLERKFDKEFFNFCKRLWTFTKTRKPVIIQLHNKYSEKDFIIIKTRNKANKLLKQWKENYYGNSK